MRHKRDSIWQQILATAKAHMVLVWLDSGIGYSGRLVAYSDEPDIHEIVLARPDRKMVGESLATIRRHHLSGEPIEVEGPAVVICGGVRSIEYLGNAEIPFVEAES